MIDWSGKTSIFKDPKHVQHFNEEGFVIVPFLSEADISRLKETYKEIHPEGVKGFYTTTFANNVEHRELVNQQIKKVCKKRIEELFENYKILFSSFIVKAPGKDSELIVHQDMTLVDETKYSGINIWCPLVDLTLKNGAIEVLPKSHRFFKTYRGSSLPDIYDGLVDEVKSRMIPLHLKAGEAVIFDQSIIHYSPPNLSDHERPVINTFVAHKEAVIKVCYWDKENHPDKVEIFDQDDNFLEEFENFGHNIFSRPTIGKSLGHFPYDFPKLTIDMLDEAYGTPELIEPKPQMTYPWYKKLFKKTT